MKESGLGWTSCAIDDAGGTARNIRGDCTNLSFATPRAVQDSTGLDKFARETILLLGDLNGSLTGVFNDAADLSHAVFSTVCSTTVTRTVSQVVSGQTLTAECLLTDYQLARSPSGEFIWTVPYVLQSGDAPTWS